MARVMSPPCVLPQDWLRRTRDRVLAARSVFSFGLHALGATENDSKPDGEFFAWLGQFQWAQRLDEGDEIILRTDAQLTQDPLLPMEKFVVGGADTVRRDTVKTCWCATTGWWHRSSFASRCCLI